MFSSTTRRQFLAQAGVCAAGWALSSESLVGTALGQVSGSRSRVVIARDEALTGDGVDHQGELLAKLLGAAMQRLSDAPEAVAAWKHIFESSGRIGIKVNTLGLSTRPVVVDAIVSGLRSAGVPAKNIIIWDRFDVELERAGFKLNKSGSGVQCRGTDGDQIGSGYQREVESSGRIGSCFSRIAAEEVDTLISVPVLKDHNLAGVSLGLKNFYGAIHNPNKYHDHNCDPYIVDVVSHRFIQPKWKLTVIDGTRAQYHAGPGFHPGFAWAFGGLIVSTDIVAADAVAADLLDAERDEKGLPPLGEENRPAKHVATAAQRGLGTGNLNRIERVQL